VKAKARVVFPVGRIAVVIALLGLALAAPTVAHAAQTHTLTGQWGGFFDDAEGVAVDQSGGPTDGNVWVANGGLNANPFTIYFDPTGNVVAGLEPAAQGGTAFSSPVAVASDNTGGPSDGDFYVADSGNNTVYKFAPDGTLVWEVNESSFPVATGLQISGISVDPTTGDVVILSRTLLREPGVMIVDPDGNFLRLVKLNFRGGRSIAVGSSGQLYVAALPEAAGGFGLDEFSPTGQFIRRLDNDDTRGVAYDAARNQVLANDGDHVAIYNATTGSQVDKFGAGTLIDGTGIAVNETSDVIYALDRKQGTNEGTIDVFSPALLPDVTTGPAAPVGASAVTLHGHVDPAGGGEVTGCEFEFGQTIFYGTQAQCDPAAPYAAPADVAAELTGLLPATEYHFRLKASNANGAAHTENDRTFVTGAGVPELLSETVADLGSDNARIDSTVKVMGADARITVEYGTSTTYGSSAPVGGRLSAASGPTDQAARTVPVQLTGLALDTTYHYRVVVSNSAGTTTGPDQVFHTFAAPENQLPDGRGYELVTPINKYAHQIVHEYGIATDNGEAVLYPATLSIGETATGSQSFAVARRVGGQWISDSPYVRPNEVDVQHHPLGLWPSDDLSGLAFSGKGYTSEGDFFGLFLSTRTSTSRISAGSLDPAVLGPSIVPETAWEPGKFSVAGASPDLSSVYFGYDGALLTQDGARTSALVSKDASGFYVYEDGQLLPADLLPDGTLDPEGAAPAATPSVFDSHLGAYRKPTEFLNQVSQDGDRAFFVSPAPSAHSVRPVELYVHRKGQSSLLVSRSSLSGGAAATGAVQMPAIFLNVEGSVSSESDSPYAAASRDGSHVVFESRDRLTSDAPEDASIKSYLFDVDSETLIYLPGVSGTAIGVANDGTRVYFVEGEELSLWEAGSGVRDVATGSRVFNTAAITPDGSTIVFSPVTPLGGFNTGGQTQVYRYDAARRSLDCISCAKEGALVTAGSYLAGERRFNYGEAPTGELKGPHYVAADGNRVFFETAQALVPTDTNRATDVYEWEEGSAHLISGGRGNESTFLVDNSASGDDVFFVTEEGLVPEDRDGARDVYDARVGATAPEAPAAGCRTSCQGEPRGAGAPVPVASEALNAAAPGGGGKQLRVRHTSVSGSKARITLALPSAGRLTVSGTDINPFSSRAATPGAYSLAVSLDKDAKKRLREKGRLSVRLRISFQPTSGGTSTTNVTATFKAGRGK
jgi:hypothetical protein